MAYLGSVVFTLALATSLVAVIASIIGIRQRKDTLLLLARQSAYLHFILITASVIILLLLLLQPDLSLIYVAENVNLALPLFYRFTALWAGQAGSMLFWNFLTVLFSVIAIRSMEKKEPMLVPYMIIILFSITFFFTALGNFSPNSDPFRIITQGDELVMAPDGRGLNPLLQHWAMIIHPPILFFGYVSFAVPYAIAMAALMRGRINLEWTRLIRRWTIFSWFFLGTGILLGGKWAYEELGWGGYWAWDPVENASLMPWLTGTAFLHSIIVQEKRGMLKVWNMVLVSISFIMTIAGTAITRSGIVTSVHSFASSNLGWFFLVFIISVALFSAALILKRLPVLKSDRPINSFLSREAGFLFNNVLLLIALFTVFFGTMYPWISETFFGERVSLTAPWFNRWMTPIGLAILFLTGAGPLLAWRKTEKKTLVKNFRIPTAVMIITGMAYVAFRYMQTGRFSTEAIPVYAGFSFAIAAFVIAGVIEEYARSIASRRRYTLESRPVAMLMVLFQNKRRYLGYMVHIGLAILFIGFAGKAFSDEGKISLRQGEAEHFAGHLFVLKKSEEKPYPADANVPLYVTRKLTVEVYKDNRLVGSDTTEKRIYPMFRLESGRYDDQQETSEPGIVVLPHQDVYFQFGGTEEGTGRMILQIWVNPLVSFVWGGFIWFVFFALLLLLPIGEGRFIRLFKKDFSVQPRAGTVQ